tara:strand:+ start:163 stop:360 length:198 start_codon:yes stop_codon:yes gene_type:complete
LVTYFNGEKNSIIEKNLGKVSNKLFSKKNNVIGIIKATDKESARAFIINSKIRKKLEALKLGSKN